MTDLDAKAIDRALDDLEADFDRVGYLTRDQVLRTIDRRNLSAEESTALRRELARRDIEVQGEAPPVEEDESEDHVVVDDADADSFADGGEERTSRATSGDSLKIFLRELGRTRLLTPDEEVQLARRMEAGRQAADSLAKGIEDPDGLLQADADEGVEAKKQFVEANLRLVVSIAKRHQSRSRMPLEDLIAEGTLGLMRAVEKFDYRLGFKFSTYAIWWVRQGIARGIADKARMIRVPVHLQETAARAWRIRRKLTFELDREPTVYEIGEQLGRDAAYVQFLFDALSPHVSLDEPIADADGAMCITDCLVANVPDPSRGVEITELEEQTRAVLATLTPREEQILRMRFGIGERFTYTLEQLGARFSVTRERIRQIEAKALVKMRYPSVIRSIEPFVGGGT